MEDRAAQLVRANRPHCGAASTITLATSASAVDSAYNTMEVYIATGIGAGQRLEFARVEFGAQGQVFGAGEGRFDARGGDAHRQRSPDGSRDHVV